MSVTYVLYPLGATVLSGAVTWRFCLRPMRNGQHCDMSAASGTAGGVQSKFRADEVEALRAEVRELSRRAETSRL
jgi:hypothetical protein